MPARLFPLFLQQSLESHVIFLRLVLPFSKLWKQIVISPHLYTVSVKCHLQTIVNDWPVWNAV